MDLPCDWYTDHDGQSRVLDPQKVGDEIERLRAAERNYQAAHDQQDEKIERLRAFVNEVATLKRDSDGFDAEATLANIQAMAARMLGLEQKAGEK